MNRNLYSRIEVCFPLYDKKLCDEIGHILQLQLSDCRKAVLLKSNMSTGSAENERIVCADGQPDIAAQETIYEYVKRLGG